MPGSLPVLKRYAFSHGCPSEAKTFESTHNKSQCDWQRNGQITCSLGEMDNCGTV